MTIKRMIDGREYRFELTEDELYDAYKEEEHVLDIEGVEDMVCGWFDEDFAETYGVDRVKFRSLIPAIAYRMRKYISERGMSWDDARDEAANDVTSEYLT